MVVISRTYVTITHVDENGVAIQHEAVREGRWQVSEQVTSFMREVAMGLCKKLKDKQELEQ